MAYQPGDRIRATFRPKRTDNLRPGLEKLIGERLEFCYGWAIDEPGEPYRGQVAWLPRSKSARDAGMGWVPTEDLEGVIPLRSELEEVEDLSPERFAELDQSCTPIIDIEPTRGPIVPTTSLNRAVKSLGEGLAPAVACQNDPKNQPSLSPAPPPCLLQVAQEEANYERAISDAFQVWRKTRPSAALPAPQEEVDQVMDQLEKLGLKDPTVILDREGNFALLWDRRLSDEEISKVHWYVKRRLGEKAAPSGKKEGE